MPADADLAAVREHYEAFPYPPRAAEQEQTRLLAPVTECLDALNHYGFGGVRNFHRDFRALCAGGGTGDSIVFLAEQLRDTGAEIVYLDFSRASMEVAKARAAVRRLKNIRWLNGSLHDLPSLGLGRFDYINCSGVLHHLADPDAGLKILEGSLAGGGVMGLMVYGQYGRTGVYQMQELLRLISGEAGPAERLADCKAVLRDLPATNWFKLSEHLFNDLKAGDAGLFDLLLHEQDRAYTVPELFRFLEGAGLKIAAFLGRARYDPARYMTNGPLLQKVRAWPLARQYAIGELLSGAIKQHTFYAVRQPLPPPEPSDPDMVFCLPVNTDPRTYADLHALAARSGNEIAFEVEGEKIRIPNSPAMIRVLQLLDGKRSVGEILGLTAGPAEEVKAAFGALYRAMVPGQALFLRHKTVPYYKTVKEMQDLLAQSARTS